MTDSEKLKLISRLITDFWEFNEKEQMEKGAVAMVTAICSIVDFEEGKEWQTKESCTLKNF